MTRRAIDVTIVLALAPAIGPIVLLLALCVRLDSPGPAFYWSPRVGRHGRPFRMLKLRSMVVGADRQGSLVTTGGDRRVTGAGRWLRRTKLDELPTLWNVMVGDMTLVGPRPENPVSVSSYSQRQRQILAITPGVTSVASIRFRHEEAILAAAADPEAAYRQIMDEKITLDLEYEQRRTVWTDFGLLGTTVAAVFRRGPSR
jgi:lipopolysaccharide/colanic/teichoic acid biosynthesis glycosyltransferase